jgi:hypothetical protein
VSLAELFWIFRKVSIQIMKFQRKINLIYSIKTIGLGCCISQLCGGRYEKENYTAEREISPA